MARHRLPRQDHQALDHRRRKNAATLIGHGGTVTSVAFSSDGNRLASGSADNSVRFWATSNKSAPSELQGLSAHGSPVVGVAMLPDNQQIVSAGADNKLRVWKPAAARVYAGHQGPVFAVAVHPNGSVFATGSADKTCKVFDLNTGQVVRDATTTMTWSALSSTPRTSRS